MQPNPHFDQPASPVGVVRFGAFELDVRSAELRKHGLKIRFQEQPFRILAMLLDHPGELVLREEIRKRLWPNDTIVEFNHSINAAIKRLREALADSADEPRYVETVARRGYRFIGVIATEPAEAAPETPQLAPPPGAGEQSAFDACELSGKTVSHYRVLEKLGSGGMGVVYRAEDLNLGRQVALKFLLEPTAAGPPQAYQRFQREARAAAALNHPNICTIYGVEECVGQPVIVMELLEGEALSARLAKGGLTLDRALAAGIQILRALDEAHSKGVAHRDLKPSNILLTKSGVKVLDFGLAKLDPAFVFGEETPSELTQEGVIVGTPRYLSPEQVQGKKADARSDIFCFGLVLYEMLTGRHAFEGENTVSVMAAILTAEPAPVEQPNVTPALERLLWRCLAKNPEERWQTARDLAAELDWIAVQPAVTARRVSGGLRKQVAWGLAAVAAITAAVLALLYTIRAAPEIRPVQFSIESPDGMDFTTSPFVSPDGTKIAFQTGDSNQEHLWLYDVGSGEFRLLPGTARTTHGLIGDPYGDRLEWLPDSRSLLAGAKRFDISSGDLYPLEGAPPGNQSWNSRGDILAGTPDGIKLYPAGGNPSRLLIPGEKTRRLTSGAPSFLPDGRHFLFDARGTDSGSAPIYLASIDGKEPKSLVMADGPGVFSAPGYLLFQSGSLLVGQRLDLKRGVLLSTPVKIAEHGGYPGTTIRSRNYSSSWNGVLAFRMGSSAAPTRMVWLDRTGRESTAIGEPADYTNPSLSPDEHRLAVGVREPQPGNRDIWVFDLARGTKSRFTSDPADDFNPTWSPDGTQIAFGSTRGGKRDLYVKAASGAVDERLLLASADDKLLEDWTADGKTLIFSSRPLRGSVYQILRLALEGGRAEPAVVLETRSYLGNARMSPNGRWMVYQSNETGHSEVYVQSTDPAGQKLQISTSGGAVPAWRGDGLELFYTRERAMMAVEIRPEGDRLKASIPKKLFEADFGPVLRNNYVVTRDGKRFLAVLRHKAAPAGRIRVIVNWPSLMTARASGRK